MIPQREVLALRDEWTLRADVIEKDWALGWLLAGIGAQPDLRSWVFKGGTCLRKCYYETYRFSEDLDFTVMQGGPEEPADLSAIFSDVAKWLADSAGLELIVDDRSFVHRRTPLVPPPRSGVTRSWNCWPRKCVPSPSAADPTTFTTSSMFTGTPTCSGKPVR